MFSGFKASVRPKRQWQSSNPRKKVPADVMAGWSRAALALAKLSFTDDSNSRKKASLYILRRERGFRAPPSAPRPDGGPQSLRSSCCGLAIYKSRKPNHLVKIHTCEIKLFVGMFGSLVYSAAHNKMISRFQAVYQARAPMAEPEPATEGSVQISGRIRYPLCDRRTIVGKKE
ncbi:hypothetical protein PoB_006609600 [Plakobranchus ocellatus]|uniref:Uncharacterized protein n=1 Tax=Plakobranchus ocellatus TaxID=259542 RepID=A0AAV4D6A7_9GAST|nr:hypothetical protein PoB_006609600 [Plakobranchus ocellatus]